MRRLPHRAMVRALMRLRIMLIRDLKSRRGQGASLATTGRPSGRKTTRKVTFADTLYTKRTRSFLFRKSRSGAITSGVGRRIESNVSEGKVLQNKAMFPSVCKPCAIGFLYRATLAREAYECSRTFPPTSRPSGRKSPRRNVMFSRDTLYSAARDFSSGVYLAHAGRFLLLER